jgi:hypothetical protein
LYLLDELDSRSSAWSRAIKSTIGILKPGGDARFKSHPDGASSTLSGAPVALIVDQDPAHLSALKSFRTS